MYVRLSGVEEKKVNAKSSSKSRYVGHRFLLFSINTSFLMYLSTFSLFPCYSFLQNEEKSQSEVNPAHSPAPTLFLRPPAFLTL